MSKYFNSRNAMRSHRRSFVPIAAGILTFFLILNSFRHKESNTNSKFCSRFPSERDIFIDNLIWQVLETPKGFVKLLNAYLDTRFGKTVVRINSNGPKLFAKNASIFCQFWFDADSPPYVVKANQIQSLWLKSHWPMPNNSRIPYMIICPFDITEKLPTSVSLTLNPCDEAENNLQIIDNQPEHGVKKQFGVCVKQISFQNVTFAMRLVEWIHLLKILGAEKIHFANRYLPPQINRVMNYLEQKGYIDVVTFLEPTGVPDIKRTWEGRTLELNMINDCFYRVRNLYEYVAIIDTDEIIMPAVENVKSWHGMIQSFYKMTKNVDALLCHSVMYPDLGFPLDPNIPEYHYILQHVQRSRKFLHNLSPFADYKSILIPHNILSVFNHGFMECHKHECRNFTIPDKLCQLSHYRTTMMRPWSDAITLLDTTVMKFKDELMAAVKATFEATNFKPEEND